MPGEEYHSLVGVDGLGDDESFTLPRASALLDAARQHRDFSVVQRLQRSATATGVRLEILIVDVDCDGVPSINPPGIQYTERLALCVSEDRSQLIDVRALRKGFPLWMHQNAVAPGDVPSLCLYDQPPRSVMRTWTASNFLHRIQVWLQGTARGELHGREQAVEQLFFVTGYELVLPWNFNVLRASGEVRFWVRKGGERPGRGGTFVLEGGPAAGPDGTVTPIEVTLPAVVHGRVEANPETLGQLADLLEARGVDLLAALKQAIQARVDANGIEAAKDDPFCVLLLHLPIARAEGLPHERLEHRAYMMLTGAFKLGAATGALTKFDGTYFNQPSTGFLAPAPMTEWRQHEVLAMEVQQCIDRKTARRQSGVSDEGPVGVLVGAGALGGCVLDLWTRCGWGQWSVIDPDHVKPHNLVRHPAHARHIGMPKAQVSVMLNGAVMQGAAPMTAIYADACDLANEQVLATLRSSNLVVDASTTVDYPRLASTRDDVGRHVSVFVTPNANAGVLLMEDEGRRMRLRTLEAQYYRAIISEEWGRDHLDGNLGTYRSGAGCRDISMVMPYSRIVAGATLFAEQIPVLALSSEPAIRVWVRDERGSVSVHSVAARQERRLPFDDIDLFIDAGIEEKLRRMRAEQLPHETGGILLGYHDFNVNALVVVDALPAPADSKASAASFERGLEGVKEAVVEAGRRTVGVVGYVGEWHSHPPGHGADPSHDDFFQLAYLALGMAEDGLPAVSLIVGACEFQVLKGTVR